MSLPVNPQSPILAGAQETIPAAGTLVVSTGLRYPLHSFGISMEDAPAAGAAFVSVTEEPADGSGIAKLKLWSWESDYTTGTAAVVVRWHAQGK